MLLGGSGTLKRHRCGQRGSVYSSHPNNRQGTLTLTPPGAVMVQALVEDDHETLEDPTISLGRLAPTACRNCSSEGWGFLSGLE